MPNFSHHSLKRRFQSVLSVLISNQAEQEIESLINLIDLIVAGDIPCRDTSKSSYLQSTAIILGLYHHQDLSNLASYFNESEYLIIALAIALCMRGEMQPRNFVSKISSYQIPFDFYDQLKLANALSESGQSRVIACSLIPEARLAFGLFCFLSTPYSWDLVNQGAGEFQISISAIASAYLGHSGGYSANSSPNNLKLAKSLGNYLLAAWAGVYDLSNIPSDFYPAIKYPEIMSLGA